MISLGYVNRIPAHSPLLGIEYTSYDAYTNIKLAIVDSYYYIEGWYNLLPFAFIALHDLLIPSKFNQSWVIDFQHTHDRSYMEWSIAMQLWWFEIKSTKKASGLDSLLSYIKQHHTLLLH